MSNIDDNRGNDPLDLLSDPILRALVTAEEAVRAEVNRERQRADAAEKSLAEARREIAAARDELALAVLHAKQIEERTFKVLGEYLEDNMRAQRGLIAIARQLLQAMGVPERDPGAVGEKTPAPVFDRRPSPSIVSTEHARPSSEHVAPPPEHSHGVRPTEASSRNRSGPGALGRSVIATYEGHADNDPITDEHRIIDQSNQADMERLNAPSRRFAGSPAFKRRNLLTGS